MSGRAVLPLLYTGASGGRAKPLRPARSRIASVIRIPERASSQLGLVLPGATPHLFVHEGARQWLERRLTTAFPGPVCISITDNRHSMVTHRLVAGVLRVRLHYMFLDAPADVTDALVRYVTVGDRLASQLVGEYIEDNAPHLTRKRRQVTLKTLGKHHDLLALFQTLNDRYFGGTLNTAITWGKRGTVRGVKRTSIKLGSYSAVERLIRIHPALDRAWVPRYFVSYVVFHEMLHHAIPVSRGAGRVMLHPPEFLSRERQFRDYERAAGWERSHTARLLRA